MEEVVSSIPTRSDIYPPKLFVFGLSTQPLKLLSRFLRLFLAFRIHELEKTRQQTFR